MMQQKLIIKNRNRSDISKFAKMADLTSLKADIDDLNVDKLKSLPVYLFKLSN